MDNTSKAQGRTLEDACKDLPLNENVLVNFTKAYSIVRRGYKKAFATISGGSDSDMVLDICTKIFEGSDCEISYYWCNTGIEYEATKRHLDDLEKKYGVTINRVRPKEPVPVACKKYGQPFLSKRVSEMIYRLQLHNFEWEDLPYKNLMAKYPNCKVALDWWCNKNNDGKKSRYNIDYNKGLKEFMIQNPPTFKISSLCCDKAKKSIVHELIEKEGFDLNIYGVRKAEGGVRSSIKSCFSQGTKHNCDEYRPIFWYTKQDKEEYCECCNITHSDCYTEYGLKRTGCSGCPFNKDYLEELEVIKKYEPQLYVAVNNIFKDSYEYTRKYCEFVRDNF